MMRLAVSNIAWPAQHTDRAYAILAEAGVPGLEVAPGLLFAGEPDPMDPTPAALDAALDKTTRAGLTLCSMQSLLFGVEGAALFGTEHERAVIAAALTRAIVLAGRLGIPNLVVGSPRNRVVPPGMDRDAAFADAAETFRRLGETAAQHGCVLAMEPNPAIYGTNFLNTLAETDAFVRLVDHPAVTVNFDVGALHVNAEFDDLRMLLDLSLPRVSHVHLSEPALAAFPRDGESAETLFRTLDAAGWNGWVSIEMRADPQDPLAVLASSIAGTKAAMNAVIGKEVGETGK